MVGIPQNKNITLGKPVLCMSLSMHLRRQKEKYRETVVKTDAVVIFFFGFSMVSVSVLFFCQWAIHPEGPHLLYLCPHLHLSNEENLVVQGI